MSLAIHLTQTGGPNVLRVEPITEVRPAQGEVWIEQEAIGVNSSTCDPTQRLRSHRAAKRSGSFFLLAALFHPGRGRLSEGRLSGTGKEPVSDRHQVVCRLASFPFRGLGDTHMDQSSMLLRDQTGFHSAPNTDSGSA
jgi:hypothetical protein